MQLFLFLFPLQHIKRRTLQNKQVVILRMAFRTRQVFGTFEKRAASWCLIKISKCTPKKERLIMQFRLKELVLNCEIINKIVLGLVEGHG